MKREYIWALKSRGASGATGLRVGGSVVFGQLSDQDLLEAYEAAIKINLDSAFIQLLLEAIQLRNINVEMVSVS